MSRILLTISFVSCAVGNPSADTLQCEDVDDVPGACNTVTFCCDDDLGCWYETQDVFPCLTTQNCDDAERRARKDACSVTWDNFITL